jgi:hypothetical protein
LKQDRASSVDGDLSQHMAVEEVLAHDAKGPLELGAIEASVAVHGVVSSGRILPASIRW